MDGIKVDQTSYGYSLTSSFPDITVESELEPPYETSNRTTPSLNSPSPSMTSICDKVRSHWKEAMKSVGEAKSKSSGPEGMGKYTIIQIVDQLMSYKIKSKEFSERRVEAFSTANSKFRIRSRIVRDGKRRMLLKKHHMDEQVKLNVYKRTLEALLYPASEPDCHSFVTWSAMKYTTCSECNYPLWGLTKQGVKCSKCGKICHERCSTLCSQNCFIQDQHSAIRDKMQRMLVSHTAWFDLMKEAFNMPSDQHTMLREEMEAWILNKLDDYRADIVITVIAVQGVFVPSNLDHRMYVSVAVGNQGMKTEVYKKKTEDKSHPTWNQEFAFMCLSCGDLIQLRVWNERDSAMAQVANKLTREGDLFLGEKIIEVQKVRMLQDVWYKLEKRTEKGPEVSGHIKVNISVTVEGEHTNSFHHYYMKLHEQLFIHCHIHNDNDLVIVPVKQLDTDEQILSGLKSLQLLPTEAQEVLDEFSLRYGIEYIFRMMLHIELLVNHHSMKHAILVINNLLKNLKYQIFAHVAADHVTRGVGAAVLMEEYMDASNFGRDKFFQVLDKLLNALKMDLKQYREFYPHDDDDQKLLETFELMETVIEFQKQAMGIFTTNKISELILDSMQECLKDTFEFIIQSSMAGDSDNIKHPALDTTREPFEFFYQILTQVKGVILEDRTVYGKIVEKYCNVNFGDISAVELWLLFSSTVEGLFGPDENLDIFAPTEYVVLLFIIKTFYDSEIRPIPSYHSKVPQFPRWFIRCVQKWLLKYQKDVIFFVDNAWDGDKNELKFAPHESQKLSSSAFHMFCYLYEVLKFTQSLESGDVEVKHVHMEDFSMVIINVVQHYVGKVSLAIPEYNDNLETMCMLLNNLQALRTNTHLLFDEMGGTENAGAGANKVLTEFQKQLYEQLTTWCTFVARSLSSEILSANKKMQSSLIKLRGQGNVERDEAKTVIEPLLNLLTSKLSIIAETSDQVVLQKCIKEVWYVCRESLHHMLLPIKREHGDHATTSISSSESDYPPHNYTHRQCSTLETMIDVFKDFFVAAEDRGMKRSTIEHGIKQLKAIITLYGETTEMLISDFILDETRNGLEMTDASCGEVHLEIDAYVHPTTGELDVNIRVISATDLKPLEVAIKPAIELNLIAPTMSTKQRKFTTTTKGSVNPNFNQNFRFTIANNWEKSELLVLAKQKPYFGKDQVIGLATVHFTSIKDHASLTLGLAPSSPISDRGRAILKVLTVRGDDDLAKEFVTLKTSQRSSSEN